MQARETRFSSLEDRLPPNNLEAEEAVLGGILIDPEAIHRVMSILKSPDVFYVGNHQKVYEAALSLANDNQPVDMMTVVNWLRSHGSDIGPPLIAQLVDRVVSSVNIDIYATLIRDKAQARKLIAVSRDIQQIGYDEAEPIAERLNKAQQLVFDIAEQREGQNQASHVGDVLTRTLDRLESGKPQGIRGTSGKFKTLYDMTGGIFPSHLHIAAAETRTGKTHFGLAQAMDYASLFPVLFISCEMTEDEITDRALSRLSGVDSHRITNGILDEGEMTKVVEGMQRLSDMNLHIWGTSNPSGTEIRSEIRRISRETGQPCKLVVLDYLQLLRRGAQNRIEDLDGIAMDCKNIATEFELCFLALAQISDRPQNNANKRPTVHDIRGCKAISHHANRIYLLYRDELHNPDTADRGCMEIDVSKNRGGREGMVKMLFDPARSWFGPYSSLGGGYGE